MMKMVKDMCYCRMRKTKMTRTKMMTKKTMKPEVAAVCLHSIEQSTTVVVAVAAYMLVVVVAEEVALYPSRCDDDKLVRQQQQPLPRHVDIYDAIHRQMLDDLLRMMTLLSHLGTALLDERSCTDSCYSYSCSCFLYLHQVNN